MAGRKKSPACHHNKVLVGAALYGGPALALALKHGRRAFFLENERGKPPLYSIFQFLF
jgi:hypothetical protein